MEIKEMVIKEIVDMIEEFGNAFCTHPNDTAKLYAASRLVDNEVMKRMNAINKRIEQDGTVFVGHTGTADLGSCSC